MKVAVGLENSCEQKEQYVRGMCSNAHQFDNYLQGHILDFLQISIRMKEDHLYNLHPTNKSGLLKIHT